MMKLVRQSWIPVLIVVALACSEDDPLPIPTIDFSNEVAEVGVPVMFDNLSTNADRYEWSFSDGQSSEEISPSVTFDSPGTIEVVLRAFTKDGQVDSLVRDITINQRYLTGYFVKSFPADSIGFDWDKDEVEEEDRLPYVMVQFIVDKEDLTEEDFENSVFGPVFLNADRHHVGNEVDNVILTNEDWVFILSDWDGLDVDNISFQDDPFSTMVVAGFNPLEVPFIKFEGGTEGSFSITGFDENENLIDIEFFFELK